MNKKTELIQLLSEKISKCTKCPELVANRTQTVVDSGNPYAKVLMLAEAPGQDEDEQGEVLIGRAGQLLSKIITACGLDRANDVYLCNICKCRPPNNRTPTPQEANNCEPYLKLQIKIVNPKFIICLGSTATKYLLKIDQPISHIRGRWFKYEEDHVSADVLCTYHPSYALRSDVGKQAIWDDLQSLMKRLS